MHAPAQAANGKIPRTPRVFRPHPCHAIVDRRVDPGRSFEVGSGPPTRRIVIRVHRFAIALLAGVGCTAPNPEFGAGGGTIGVETTTAMHDDSSGIAPAGSSEADATSSGQASSSGPTVDVGSPGECVDVGRWDISVSKNGAETVLDCGLSAPIVGVAVPAGAGHLQLSVCGSTCFDCETPVLYSFAGLGFAIPGLVGACAQVIVELDERCEFRSFSLSKYADDVGAPGFYALQDAPTLPGSWVFAPGDVTGAAFGDPLCTRRECGADVGARLFELNGDQVFDFGVHDNVEVRQGLPPATLDVAYAGEDAACEGHTAWSVSWAQ